jgi:hypothetical protein
MERLKSIKRVMRALARPPQARNGIDLSCLTPEAAAACPLLARGGLGLLRDLCHVLTGQRLERGDLVSAAALCEGHALVMVSWPFWGRGTEGLCA